MIPSKDIAIHVAVIPQMNTVVGSIRDGVKMIKICDTWIRKEYMIMYYTANSFSIHKD